MVNHAQLTVKAPAKDTGFNTAAAYISYNQRVRSQRPSFGYRFCSKIPGAPILRRSLDGGKLAGLKVCKNSASGSSCWPSVLVLSASTLSIE